MKIIIFKCFSKDISIKFNLNFYIIQLLLFTNRTTQTQNISKFQKHTNTFVFNKFPTNDHALVHFQRRKLYFFSSSSVNLGWSVG